jgi:hypothetical protein
VAEQDAHLIVAKNEKERQRGGPGQDIAINTFSPHLDLLPPKVSTSPNNAKILWIHQGINPLIRLKYS